MLADELPITQHLGLTVDAVTEEGVVLGLPLAANRNHKGAIFAGSLNAAAILAGWCVLWAAAARAGIQAHAVIQDGSVRFLRPVRSDAVARCRWPPPEVLAHALEVFRRRRRARVALEATVEEAGEPAVRFSGRYVLVASS